MTRDEATQKIGMIILDIQDRQGIGDEFDMTDDDTKQEMKEIWISILMKQ